MKFTVKQASTGRYIVHLKGHGQFGEAYETYEEALRACIHANQNLVFA